VDESLRLVVGLFAVSAGKADSEGTTIVAFRSHEDIEALIPALRRLASER
jgi:hypothetical protein